MDQQRNLFKGRNETFLQWPSSAGLASAGWFWTFKHSAAPRQVTAIATRRAASDMMPANNMAGIMSDVCHNAGI
jgi:hypothetical protein